MTSAILECGYSECETFFSPNIYGIHNIVRRHYLYFIFFSFVVSLSNFSLSSSLSLFSYLSLYLSLSLLLHINELSRFCMNVIQKKSEIARIGNSSMDKTNKAQYLCILPYLCLFRNVYSMCLFVCLFVCYVACQRWFHCFTT